LVLPIGTDVNNRIVRSKTIGAATPQKLLDGKSETTVPKVDSGATNPASPKDGWWGNTNAPDKKPSEPAVEKPPDENFGGNEASTFPPVTVLLDLISDGRNSDVTLGVVCIGYISQVRTRFKEPWLQPATAGGKNMPSLLECDFTFVHFPGHTNRFQQNVGSYDQTLVNAYAEEVRSNFYDMAMKSAATNTTPSKFGTGSLEQGGAYRGLSPL
jgi:hypothetical protein